MATITIKNIPDELYERLKLLAKANKRSINSEVIVCIEEIVGRRALNVDDFLARAKILREANPRYQIDDTDIEEGIN